MTDKELKLRFKMQSRCIARSLQDRFTKEETDATERCGGGGVCTDCGLEWYDHPQLDGGLAEGLHVTCAGKLVKL